MKTLKDFEAALAAQGLSNYSAQLKPYLKNSIHMELEPADDAAIPVGASKMGGLPDLPRNVEWFREDLADIPLSFLCQINFAEVKPYDLENKLPASGILYLFYNCSMDGMPWGFDPADSSGKVAYYYDGDLSALERKAAPTDLEEKGCLFGAATLQFEAFLDLPDPYSAVGNTLALPDDAMDQYWDLLSDIHEPQINKLLGHSDNIQFNMELECELVSHGLYCGNAKGYTEGREKSYDKNTGRWNLLLQIDSNEEIGMMWGDCGRLYLWITDEDLAAKNFEMSWLIAQCW